MCTIHGTWYYYVRALWCTPAEYRAQTLLLLRITAHNARSAKILRPMAWPYTTTPLSHFIHHSNYSIFVFLHMKSDEVYARRVPCTMPIYLGLYTA